MQLSVKGVFVFVLLHINCIRHINIIIVLRVEDKMSHLYITCTHTHMIETSVV